MAVIDTTKTNLTGIEWTGRDLPGFDFSQMRLRGAKLRTCNLTGSSFVGADLTGVDFSGSVLDGCDFNLADVTDEQLAQAKSAEGVKRTPVIVPPSAEERIAALQAEIDRLQAAQQVL
jgi:uncharacterized protein YjbI with pentapeptide repeats